MMAIKQCWDKIMLSYVHTVWFYLQVREANNNKHNNRITKETIIGVWDLDSTEDVQQWSWTAWYNPAATRRSAMVKTTWQHFGSHLGKQALLIWYLSGSKHDVDAREKKHCSANREVSWNHKSKQT